MDRVHDRRSNDGPGYLFLNSFSSRVSDDWKYVCPRRHHYIIARDQKSDLHGTSFQLLSKINRCSSQDSFAFQGCVVLRNMGYIGMCRKFTLG